MSVPLVFFVALRHCFVTTLIVLLDVGRLITSRFVIVEHLPAENLFLWKQLALFRERKAKPRKGRSFHAVDHGDSEPNV